MDKNILFEAALDVTKNSYSPYSNFRVGAALLLKNGQIITGTNVENASFGLTNCAERSAIFAAVSQGYRKEDFQAFCVAGFTKDPIAPCGACLQVISELCNREMPIFLINDKGNVLETDITKLLPYAFIEVE